MSKDRDADLKALLRAVVEPEPESPPTAFAIELGEAMKGAIQSLRTQGVLEMHDEHVDGLAAEVATSALDASSRKQMLKRAIRTLLESERVEEVYATDDALAAALRGFLEGD
jgi:hypothetical protein